MNHSISASRALALGLVVLSLSLPALAANPLKLLAPAPDDLIAAQLVTPRVLMDAAPLLDRTPVQLSWALDGKEVLAPRPQPFAAASREYWLNASAAELQNGVRLPLSAPGAILRISPHGGEGDARLSLGDVQIRLNGQRVGNAVQSIADEDALRAAGMDVPAGSIALRLEDSVVGVANLAVPTARRAYLVHVFEPASPIALRLAAERDGVAGGASLSFHTTLEGATLARVEGLIRAPDGASQPALFERQTDGSYRATVTPDLNHAGRPGLWEMHVSASSAGRLAIPRDARTAFAVSLPVARFDGTVQRATSSQGGLALAIGVETRSASRYAVSGVLYGSDTEGRLQPVAIAQSAAWLGVGRGGIELRFDRKAISLGAPWELRDLRLVNQGDLSLQERRERALALD